MNKLQLQTELHNIGVNCSNDSLEKLEVLMNDTLTTNEKFNLTAIKNPEEFRELMNFDSAYPLSIFNFNNKEVIDIGTGAGYPGLVLATLSEGSFTLLDSTNKKINHINEFVKNNDYKNVSTVCERAEDYARTHREQYDYAIARAVAPLYVLVELIVPLLKTGGSFIALKGSKAKEELLEAEKILKNLDSVVDSIHEYSLPESGEKRFIIVIKKNKASKSKYPRNYCEIIK